MPEHHRMKRQILQQNDSSIIWLEQQRSAIRVKRSILPTSFESNRPGLNDKLRNLWDTTQQFMFSFGLNQNKLLHRFNDELWPSQWHIHSSGFSRFDHGITRVWDMGFTGKGIVVTILDDGKKAMIDCCNDRSTDWLIDCLIGLGLEWNHSDLHANYDHNASYDMNDDDPDPSKFLIRKLFQTNQSIHWMWCVNSTSIWSIQFEFSWNSVRWCCVDDTAE